MSEPTQSWPRPAERAPEVAVAPLNAIDRQDVGAAAEAFDKWLRKISYDYITLERLSTVAGSLPAVGNIMALIDAVMNSGHMTALNQTLLPDQDAIMKQHARDSVTPPSPYISVTSAPRVAEYFATNGGTTSGTV